MFIRILNVAGLEEVAKWQRLPTGKIDRTDNLGPRDVALMRKLVLAGDEHAKGMRMVVAWLLIKAPRYWWQQFDTYRVGVEKLSGSTMHTLMDGITEKDFTRKTPYSSVTAALEAVREYVQRGELARAKAALPEGFLQQRLVIASYQALRRMWLQRRGHKLEEWRTFLDALRELPLADDLIFVEASDG